MKIKILCNLRSNIDPFAREKPPHSLWHRLYAQTNVCRISQCLFDFCWIFDEKKKKKDWWLRSANGSYIRLISSSARFDMSLQITMSHWYATDYKVNIAHKILNIWTFFTYHSQSMTMMMMMIQQKRQLFYYFYHLLNDFILFLLFILASTQFHMFSSHLHHNHTLMDLRVCNLITNGVECLDTHTDGIEIHTS